MQNKQVERNRMECRIHSELYGSIYIDREAVHKKHSSLQSWIGSVLSNFGSIASFQKFGSKNKILHIHFYFRRV